MANKTRMDTDYDSDVTDASFVSDTTRNSENLLSPNLLGLNMLHTSHTDEGLQRNYTRTDVESSPIIPLQSSARQIHMYDEDPIQVTTVHEPGKDMSDVESNASELILSDTRFRNIPHQFPTRYNKVAEITKLQGSCKETSKKPWKPPYTSGSKRGTENNVKQYGSPKPLVQHADFGGDVQTQETICSQLPSSSKITLSNEEVDNPTRSISASQSLFGDTQNSQDETQAPESQSIFHTQKHLNIVGENMLNVDSQEVTVLASQKQDGLMNCLTLSQVVGDCRNDDQIQKTDNTITTTQISSTSSQSSIENINPIEDWKNLSKPEQHYREKKVIEKMNKIQEKLKNKLENDGAAINMEAVEKMKQKYKLLQNVLKKITEYHKEERKRLSDLIQKSNKTKAEKMVLKSSVHQLSGRQKDVFRIYQNHQKLGILMKEKLASKKLSDTEQNKIEQKETIQGTMQVASAEEAIRGTKQIASTDLENRKTKNIEERNAVMVLKEPNAEKSELQRNNIESKTVLVSRNENVNSSIRNLSSNSVTSLLSGKIIGSQTQNNQMRFPSNIQSKPYTPIQITPKPQNPNLMNLNSSSGRVANMTSMKMATVLGPQSNNKQIILVPVPAVHNTSSGAAKVLTIPGEHVPPAANVDKNVGTQQTIARPEFKSPIYLHKENTTENISPSTASCSDVFPVKSQEIHRRVQMRLSQLQHGENESKKVICVQKKNQHLGAKTDVIYTTRNDTLKKTNNIQQSSEDVFNAMSTQANDRELKYPPLIYLLNEGILKPGKNILSMTCKNITYIGSLNEEGKIESVGGEKFQSPVQWLKSVTDGEKVVKSRAYREVHYLDKTLLSYVDGTVKLTQKDIESIARNGINWSSKASFYKINTPKLVKAGDSLKDLLSDCKILLLEDADIVPSKDLPENFWTDEFSSVKMSCSFWNTVDVW